MGMVQTAVFPFTCGSLREVCMEARAVTAGLPALLAAEEVEAVAGRGPSVLFTYHRVSSRNTEIRDYEISGSS